MSGRAVATFNIGSSSLKFSLFEIGEAGALGACRLRGAVRNLAGPRELSLSDASLRASLEGALAGHDEPAALVRALAVWLGDGGSGGARAPALAGIGHRIVHGGRDHRGPAIASDTLLRSLEALSPFAPAHQPHNLAGVRAVQEALPDTPQTLSFDTAFHRTMPAIAELYALPRALCAEGIVRFGFHGLSYAHMAETIGELLGVRPKRLLGLHLGSGASACAMLDGESVATSMGLTALDGLPMATRCGDLDPGVVLHLIKDRGLTAEAVSDLLYRQSGLLGVSGLSGDTRVLLESKAPEAREAIALYCYRVAREAGSLAVAMGGIDAIAFSGGVGENAPAIRAEIAGHLSWLGIRLDADANAANASRLSPDGAPPVVCIPADEERIIAEECAALAGR